MGEKQRTLDEVNAMMAELGMDPSMMAQSTAPVNVPRSAGVSAGPGRGATSGPGRGGGGVSSGPGGLANGGVRVSNGPGAMMANGGVRASTGPGNGNGDYRVSSGPGAMAIRASRGPGTQPGGQQFPSQTPDGRPVNWTGPPCGLCGEMVIGPVINALENSWHPEHFICEHCQKPFKGGIYVEHEGKPYCENDFNELFETKCPVCKGAVTDKCIKACNRVYHPEHFFCFDCGSALKGKPFREHEGEPYCLQCMQARTTLIDPVKHICSLCKKPIIGEYLFVFGQHMHPEHFRCTECNCEFKAGNCHEYEKKLYCYPCYLKMLKNVCGLCEKPIVGRSVTGMGKVWHPEHFCCFECKNPFAGSGFWERDGEAYCELHYKTLFAKICHGCAKAIVTDGIAALGSHFHKDCFICSACYHPLGKDIVDIEGKVFCYGCYKKLPKAVRKRVDKKKEGSKKAQKDRQKQARKEMKNMPTAPA